MDPRLFFFRYRQLAVLKAYKFIDNHVDPYPLDSDSEEDNNSDSPYFTDDEKVKILGMHRDRLKEMLFMLQFSGFETTLKCPCSKVYHSDLLFLYGCPLADKQCRGNQSFQNIGALYQHFNSVRAVFSIEFYLNT